LLQLVANRVQLIAAFAVIILGFVSVVVASLREVAIVLFTAIAPNTFLREVPLTTVVSSSAA
jgi:hypothetical protein